MATKTHRTPRQQTGEPQASYFDGMHYHTYGTYGEGDTTSEKDDGSHFHCWYEPDSPDERRSTRATGEGHAHEVGR